MSSTTKPTVTVTPEPVAQKILERQRARSRRVLLKRRRAKSHQ